MALEISEKLVDGILVMEITGALVVGDEANRLRARLRQMLADGTGQLILDLSHVIYIDSAGLGAIVAGYTTARNLGGSLKLAKIQPQFREQLNVSKLTTIFEVYPTVEEALKSFAKSP